MIAALAPSATNKAVPNDAGRNANNLTRKRKADIALGSLAGSPLKHGGYTDCSNAGYLRGKGVDFHDLGGLCIFDSLAIDGLTIRHDDLGEAHLVIRNAGGANGGRRTASATPQAVTHRHIIWSSQHSVDPVVSLPWQAGPSVSCTATTGRDIETDEMFLFPTAEGGAVEVNWLRGEAYIEWNGVIDALLDGFDDSDCGLAASDPHPNSEGADVAPAGYPTTVAAGFDSHTRVAATSNGGTPSSKGSPFFCDFFEIGPPDSGFDYIDADKDLGQDLTFEEI